MVENMLGIPGSKIGISRLIDKSLIYVSLSNKLGMHDLIRQMGKDIICSENQLGNCRRLSHPKDICHAVRQNKGTEEIRGISLDMSRIKDVQSSPKAFEKMENLRYLILYDKDEEAGGRYPIFYDTDEEGGNKIHLSDHLKSLSDELRFLHWKGCPLESLPFNFSAEKLVKLDMVGSKLKELWTGVQDLKNLKWIDLKHSKDLVRIPDLSKAVNLEVLKLGDCSSLVEIPPSIKYLSKLIDLDLSRCTSLCSLPSCLHLESLKRLDLSFCTNISVLPNIACYEWHTGLERAPVSCQLSFLSLIACDKLESLPDSICNLKYLTELSIDHCVNLHRLPENFGNLESLEILNARESGLRDLPDSICHLKSIRWLHFTACKNLVRLPMNLLNLESLWGLEVNNCTSLKSLFQLEKERHYHPEFEFGNCVNLEEVERNKMMNNVFERPWLNRRYLFISNLQKLCIPGSEVEQRMKYKNKNGSSMSLQFTQFERLLDVRGLYFCVVFDPNVFHLPPDPPSLPIPIVNIGCDVILTDEHRRSSTRLVYKSAYFPNLQSKHVFLWRDEFKPPNNPPLGQIDFVFFISDISNSDLRCDDAIIKCGVHPVFCDEFNPASSGSDSGSDND